MKFILGKKMRMTQIWEGDKVIPVTPVQAGPCLVVQIKNENNDGYSALQLGFDSKKEKNISKPLKGHLAKAGKTDVKYLKEFRITEAGAIQTGDLIKIDTFEKGDIIDASGVSKGKGFQGVVKRHGFHGFRKTHGNKDQERHSGSVGPKGPAHVFKGTRMGGHMGDEQVTTKNLEVADLDLANNIIYLKGAVPGATNSLVWLKGKGELKITKPETEVVKEEKVEEPVVAVETPVVEEVKEEVKEEAPVVETAPVEAEAPVVEVKEEAPVEEVKEETPVTAEAKEEEVKTAE